MTTFYNVLIISFLSVRHLDLDATQIEDLKTSELLNESKAVTSYIRKTNVIRAIDVFSDVCNLRRQQLQQLNE